MWSGRSKRRLSTLGLVVSLSLVFSACGDGDAGTPTTVSAAATSRAPADTTTTLVPDKDDLSSLDLPANPLPVSFRADESSAVSADIGDDGGVLTTTSSEGVHYTLTIPAAALFGPTEITMTPISLADSPLATAEIFGVSLEPDGLYLFEPATLEITADELAPDTAAFFSAGGGGEDFHLSIGDLGESATTILSHFSTAGAIRAQQDELHALWTEYRPSARHDRYEQEGAALLQEIALDDLQTRARIVEDLYSRWLGEIEADASQPMDAAALNQLLGEFIQARKVLAIESYIPGYEASVVREALTAAGEALHAAIYRQFQADNLRCIQDQDPDTVFAMYRWVLIAAWLTGQGYDSGAPDLIRALQQCMRFELEFTSGVDGTSDPISFSVEVAGKIPLDSVADGPTLNLEAGRYVGPILSGRLTGTGELTAPAGSDGCRSTSIGMEVILILHVDVRFGELEQSDVVDGQVVVRFPSMPPSWDCGIYGSTYGGLLWWPWWQKMQEDLLVDDLTWALYLQRVESGVFSYSNRAVLEGSEVTVGVKVSHSPQLP